MILHWFTLEVIFTSLFCWSQTYHETNFALLFIILSLILSRFFSLSILVLVEVKSIGIGYNSTF